MRDQILSQEEIDALLKAMDRGEVDLKQGAAREKVVENYNLTAQTAMLRSQFHALEEVYDRFATSTAELMTGTFGQRIEIGFVSTEMIRYGEFTSKLSNPTSLNFFTMEPLVGAALLVIEPGLVFSLIDCMFGGNGKPLDRIREFTLIEQRMMKKFCEELLGRLEDAWSVVHKVNIRLKKMESKPEFAHLVNPNESMIAVVFSVKGREFEGNLSLCISYLMLEPIRAKLSSKYRQEEDLNPDFSEQIQLLLQDTPVKMVAELGQTTQTIAEILSLQVDDVIQLNTGPKDDIVVAVDGVPKYFVFPGVVKGNRAVEITKLIKT
jgi:flagellar motor switch protein FliM